MSDELGTRMKRYEALADSTLMQRLPILARMDGRAFHSFTRGLRRPFDERLHSLMVDVTAALLAETGAAIGYTQSDEISIAWAPEANVEPWFGGRVQKMASSLAAVATAAFGRLLPDRLPEKFGSAPLFDARVWTVPDLTEASNAFLWREHDAARNSVQMLGRAHFSHNALIGKGGPEIQDMLHQIGVNWNDIPAWAKRGSWVRREKVVRAFTTDEIDRLPPKHAARTNPDLVVERTDVCRIDAPPFGAIVNKAGFMFRGEAPEVLHAP